MQNAFLPICPGQPNFHSWCWRPDLCVSAPSRCDIVFKEPPSTFDGIENYNINLLGFTSLL